MLERGFAEDVEKILAASYTDDNVSHPQMLLFSGLYAGSMKCHSMHLQVRLVQFLSLNACGIATVPSWVEETARRYMGDDCIVVDLIGQQKVRTAVTVEHKAICCPYQERPTVINDVIQVFIGSHCPIYACIVSVCFVSNCMYLYTYTCTL